MGLRRVVAICAWSLFLRALSGCSPKEAQSEAKSAVEELIKTIEVREAELGLDLVEITLEKPATYVFRAVNDGCVVYALETEGERVEDKTQNILPDESTQLKVSLNPGTYDLYRLVGDSKRHDMNGTVTVREG